MTVPVVILIFVLALMVPGAWLIMLALGNFGFSQFGLIDCLPAGLILGLLANKSGS